MREDLLKDLVILNEEQLRGASKEQLAGIFNQLESMKKKIDSELISTRVTLESQQAEKDRLIEENRSQFGVSSIEELNILRDKKIKELSDLGEALKMKSEEGI